MKQNTSALSHSAAPDSLSALRAAPRSESRAVEGSELPARPLDEALDALITEYAYCVTDEWKTVPWTNDLAVKTESARAAIHHYARAAIARCVHCDDTGLVHRADGEFLGECTCDAKDMPFGRCCKAPARAAINRASS